MGPLEGIKVIDMTTVLMGPYATQMLGDYGADIVKVESLDGDVTRQIGPTRHPGMGPVFLNTNRNKRSICLDLKKPAGRDAVLRLIKTADVLVYNVRPQAMARLRLGYDAVSKINPRLIYAGVFGFGRDGLRVHPKFATFAGRAVNIDAVYAELARILETKTTAEWTAILEKADVPVMPMHDLESLLQDPHIVATDFFPVVDHPTEGRIRSMRPSARWSETPVETPRLAPRLSEHSAEILREAGFAPDEIAALVRDGVTKAAPNT